MKSFKRIWLVAKRELVDQMRDWRILMPMIILTMLFPYLMNVAARAAVDYINRYGGGLIATRILPFLILVVGYFPVTGSLVVALEAFVGEKERGTIEPLLSSPLADEHLYLGKLLAGSIVPLAVSYIGIGLYLGGLLLQHIGWPDSSFIFQTLVLTAVQTVLMVSAAIVVSTQSTSVRAANLLASFIVIPVAILIQGESALMFWGTNNVLWYAVIGVTIITMLVIRLGIVHFKRENLLGREIDMLNIKWAWQTFKKAFIKSEEPLSLPRYLRTRLKPQNSSEQTGLTLQEALWLDWNQLLSWYREDVFLTLRRMLPPFGVPLAIGVGAILAAYFYVSANLQPGIISDDKIKESLNNIGSFLTNNGSGNFSALMLFVHNLQAEVLIMALGVFSFGVLSIFAYVGNFALIGAALGAMPSLGLSPWLGFVSGILPHGIVELPSIIMVSAAALNMGLRLVTPDEGRSLGETLIITLADVTKVLLAICIPLLVLAALIEANITPRILLAALGHTFNVKP